MTTIIVVDEAEEQLRAIDDWWRANRREAPTLVVDEFQRCTTLLESSPDIGTGFHRTTIPGVRRLPMKTRHVVYYVHDARNASGDRSKPASCGRVKSGQLLQDGVPVTRDRSVLQVSS